MCFSNAPFDEDEPTNENLPDSISSSTSFLRYEYLNSIRGLAALMVVLSHCWLMTASTFRIAHQGIGSVHSLADLLFYTLSKLLNETGRSAVMIFFVLSGFVLAVSLMSRPMRYASFAAKRFFRIYPAFLVVILAAYALHLLIGVRHENMSSWMSINVLIDMSVQSLIGHLAMLGLKNDIGLDSVIWTLVYELRISLLFPLILLLVLKFRWKSVAAFMLISLVATSLVLYLTGTVARGFDPTSTPVSLLDTCFFLPYFALGAYLAVDRERLANWGHNLPWWLKSLYCLVMLYFFIKIDYSTNTLAGCLVDYLRGIGAAMLIVLALGSKRLSAGLGHDWLIWLGRISYSLYLVHVPIMYVVTQYWGETWSPLHDAVIIVPASLIAAHFLSRWIEYPAMDFGKRLAARL